MPLTPGSRLGPYEILGALGAGGMGEVYRARDTKLHRDVAIKILPDTFAADPDRVARFEREARTLASLNHPNIAHMYGLEGAALVMELVEGSTLSQRLVGGAIPLDEALPIAKQIAEAVEAAHEQGIIHRDLKPANIKVRPDGTVKVLDFGLAKVTEAGSAGGTRAANLTQSPTLTSPAIVTGIGVMLGTAAYMSPEQARGKVVDKRTDIWAFGCVFYEMLTGRRAFAGDEVSLLLAQVLKGEPDWAALPEDLSPGLKVAIKGCLQKDPQQRTRDMGDVRLAIDGRFDLETATKAVGAAAPSGWRRALPWGGAIVLSAATAMAAWAVKPRDPVPVTRAEIALPYISRLNARLFTLSPDGASLIYAEERAGRGRLMRRDLTLLVNAPVSGTDGSVANPFMSPDGRWIGFVARTGLGWSIRKVPASGGASVTICEIEGAGPQSPVWLADETIVFGSTNGLMRVSAGGGTPRPITSTGFVGGPQGLPNGQAMLFHVNPGLDGDGLIEALVLSTGERRKITTGTDPRYLPTGHLVFARNDGALWVAPFDAGQLRFTREPVPLPFSVEKRSASAPMQMAVAANGTLAYLPGQTSAGITPLVWVDRAGTATPARAEPGVYAYPRLSPDDKRVALSSSNDIWVLDFERATRTRLTRNRRGSGNSASILAWGPRERVTFVRGGSDLAKPDASTIEWTRPDGNDPVQVLVTSDGLIVPGSWSPDGLVLAYQRRVGGHRDLWVFRPGTPDRDEPFVATPANERAPMFSPDGRSIAYVSDSSGIDEVYVQRYPASGERKTVSNNGGVEPRWSRDGHELFFRQGDAMMAVSIALGDAGLSLGPPRRLFEGPYMRDNSGAAAYPNYDVSTDGRFLMVGTPPTDDARAVIVLNWFEELKRLVPAKQ